MATYRYPSGPKAMSPPLWLPAGSSNRKTTVSDDARARPGSPDTRKREIVARRSRLM